MKVDYIQLFLFIIYYVGLVCATTTTPTTAESLLETDDCRSNKTHIAWQHQQQPHHNNDGDDDDNDDNDDKDVSIKQQRRQRHLSPPSCHWQTLSEARKESYRYLRNNVMKFDLPFLETLGFDDDNDNDDDNTDGNIIIRNLPDGLSDGMIGKTIDYALLAKIEFHHADQLPQDIWQEYVLNYANTNEARNNWRPLLWSKLRWLASSEFAASRDNNNNNEKDDVVSRIIHTINANMWTILAPTGIDYIYFKGGSTPIVFDPMSVMVYGYGSCTGVSILFCNALRTVGIPARVAGTAAWGQDRLHGNHNWIEVWKDGKWYFLEPSPQSATSSSSSPDNVDDLERPPCKRWFCSAERFGRDIDEKNATLVHAARLTASTATTSYYPLAWEWNNRDVPGEDVTEFYREQCGKCPS